VAVRSTRLSNRFDKRLMFAYMTQPVVKPVVQPVVSCKRGINLHYSVGSQIDKTVQVKLKITLVFGLVSSLNPNFLY